MENETKSWYQSKTIWASVITVLAVGLGYVGYEISPTDQGELVETASSIVAMITSLITIYGRVKATKTIA